MPFELTIGRPGTGKSMDTAKITLWLLERSKRIYSKGIKIKKEDLKEFIKHYKNKENIEELKYSKGRLYGVVRKVATNFHLNQTITEKYSKYWFYWDNPKELLHLKDFDLVIDEIANYFPSDTWKEQSHHIRRMFAQHRKRGMEIFANTQDYRMLDINCRRMLSKVYQLFKIIGSRSPSATLPKVYFPWGIIAKYEIDVESIEEDKEKERVGLPEFFFITKRLTSLYDTNEDIKPSPLPDYDHLERKCQSCTYKKVYHT